MKLLLIGLCIVLFDINLAVGNAYVGLIPDVLGYGLMLYALNKRENNLPVQERVVQFTKLAIIVSAVVYLAALLGIGTLLEGWIWVGLDVGCFVLESYVAFLVASRMKFYDAKGEVGKNLMSRWRVSVIFGAVAFCSLLSPASTLLLAGFSAVADIYLLRACFKHAKTCAFV